MNVRILIKEKHCMSVIRIFIQYLDGVMLLNADTVDM